MPNPEGGPNPQEVAEQNIASRIEQHFKTEDEGIPQESLQKALDFGQYMAMSDKRTSEKYEAIKADPENEQTNNIWTIFSPSNARRMQRLLNELRDLGPNPSTDELEDTVEGLNNYLGTALYFLKKKGYLSKAFTHLGETKTERFLELAADRDSINSVKATDASTLQKLAEQNSPERQKEFDRLVNEFYIALYDLGVDAARLDK